MTDWICLMSWGREFQTEGAAGENERCPNVLVFVCGMRRVLESDEHLLKWHHKTECEVSADLAILPKQRTAGIKKQWWKWWSNFFLRVFYSFFSVFYLRYVDRSHDDGELVSVTRSPSSLNLNISHADMYKYFSVLDTYEKCESMSWSVSGRWAGQLKGRLASQQY